MISKDDLTKESVSAINLAIEKPDSYFLSDDDDARFYAINIGLNVIGTHRVLMDAAVKGEIKSSKELVEQLLKLKNNDYYVSNEMINDIVNIVENRIRLANERYRRKKEGDLIDNVRSADRLYKESLDISNYRWQVYRGGEEQ